MDKNESQKIKRLHTTYNFYKLKTTKIKYACFLRSTYRCTQTRQKGKQRNDGYETHDNVYIRMDYKVRCRLHQELHFCLNDELKHSHTIQDNAK